MSCVENTNSIDLGISGGMLEADLNVDPNAQNLLSVSSAGTLASLNGGWLPAGATLAYSSADSPTFVATTSIDLTGIVPVGAKFRCVQSASTLYFIVTAISSTTITLYGGTDYALTNTTITNPYFSYMRVPYGFPIDPNKWSVVLDDTTSRAQSSPSSGSWYAPGTLTVTLPIGEWNVQYRAAMFLGAGDPGASALVSMSLSTSSSSVTDADFTVSATLSANSGAMYTTLNSGTKSVVIASKTPYYLIIGPTSVGGTITSIGFGGNKSPTIVRAVCTYL